MLEAFEKELRRENLSENTISAYLFTVRMYMQTAGEFSKKNLLAFKGFLIETYKPATVNLRIQAINKYLDFTKRGKLRLSSVKVRQKNFLENVISDADYRFFKNKLKKNKNKQWYFVVRYLAATGAGKRVDTDQGGTRLRGAFRRVLQGRKDAPPLHTQGTEGRNRIMAAEQRGYLRVSFFKQIRQKNNSARHFPSIKKVRRKVRRKPKRGVSALLPPQVCKKFFGKVQRYSFSCRPYGAREHRDHPHLSQKDRLRAKADSRRGGYPEAPHRSFLK